jgi:hypothetical protein
MRFLYFTPLLFLLVLFSCKQENKTLLYEVSSIDVEPNNSGKDKEKSQEQFLNIAYANIYQQPLSPNELVDLSDVITSIGDKQVAYETVIAKMMAEPDVQLPTKADMDADVEQFVIDTYKRFFVRLPSEAEKTWFVNFIESNPNLTPEHIYFTFATCNEYYFY